MLPIVSDFCLFRFATRAVEQEKIHYKLLKMKTTQKIEKKKFEHAAD